MLGTEQTLAALLKSFFVLRRLSRYDLITTSEYFSSFGLNLRLLLTGCRAKHVVIGLNQSRWLLRTGFPPLDFLINLVFRRSNLVVVHSRKEISQFSELHKIPEDRFYFSLWGYDLPPSAPAQFSRWPRPYVCLVGRNNRDLVTFFRACDGMPVDGIVITSNYEPLPVEVPPNVFVFRELPQNETLDCIKNAFANLILLKDDKRGAGHITAVSAMLSGSPIIKTDADAIEDYLINGVSAIGVSLEDAEGARSAIKSLIDAPHLAARLSSNAKAYAQRWLTHEASSQRINAALERVRRDERFAIVDAEWLKAYEGLKASSKMTFAVV